jgi:hypothetical protein
MESNITFCNKGHQSLADFKDAMRDVGDTLHIINVEKNVSGLLFHFFLLNTKKWNKNEIKQQNK